METTTTRGRGRPQAEFQNQIPASLFDDSAFCSLNAMQRLLLIAMIARADRHGRGMARSSMLRVSAFDGLGITDEKTHNMLGELVDLMAGSQFELLVYTVDRNPYYAFPRWFETQNMQYVPKTSRYPAPPDTDDPAPPTPPQGQPDGSADLPPERKSAPATVPTRGETPAEEPRSEGPDETQKGSADSDPDKAACLELINRRRPDWVFSGDSYREFLAYEDRLPWAVIRTAVDKTMAAGARDLNYCIRIMERYVEGGVRTVGDVEALDAEFERQKKLRQSKAAPQARGATKPERKSNVILKREPKEDGYFDGVFKQYDPEPA